MSDNLASAETDRTRQTRERGMAAALLLAPWLIVAANTGNSIISLNGGDDTHPRDALALATDHPVLEPWANLAGLLGSLLLVPAVLGIMRITRRHSARLGLVGGVLMIAGYICYFAMIFQGFTVDAMVTAGGSVDQDVEILQATLDEPRTLWVYLLFVLGNFVGTFLLGIAVLRSRTVPRAAGVGLMAWSVFHLVGVPFFEVAGATAQAVAMGIVAIVILKSLPDRPGATPERDSYELLRK
jgi:hypothetical protein